MGSSMVLFDQKSHLEPKVSNHDATLSGTTADNGDAIDCQNYNGPVVYSTFQVAEAGGSPTAFTVTCKIQESADGSTGWTDCATQDTAVISADKGAAIVRAHRTKRYVRNVMTPAFTGGSSPSIAASSVVMGQKQSVS